MTKHALQRAAERYEADLTAAQLERIVADIEAGACPKLRGRRNGCTKHVVSMPGGRAAIAVYNAADQCVVTFLPVFITKTARHRRHGTKPSRRPDPPRIAEAPPPDVSLDAVNDPAPVNNILAQRLQEALKARE